MPSVAHDSDLVTRHLAGAFEFGELLWESAFSRVYRATRVSDRLDVAIKISPVGHQINTNTLDSILHRLEISRSLNHPHVVRSIACAVDVEEALILQAMEWVDGKPLLEAVHAPDSAMTIGAATELFGQIASGIDALHEAGLIHRDVKPQNILIRKADRTAVLADLGAALCRTHFDVDRELTCGTPAYVAPEQIIGTSFGSLVDIYAFGAVVYFTLTRTLPFDCNSVKEHLYAHVHGEPVPIRRRNRNWPTDLERALNGALSNDPLKRPASATILAGQIREALQPFTPIRLTSFYDGTFARMSSGEVPINF